MFPWRPRACLTRQPKSPNLSVCRVFPKPSYGLEPETPSLPWRFRGGTGGHGRTLAITFFLQIRPYPRAGLARVCPRVPSLLYPSRTRDSLSVRETSNTCRSDRVRTMNVVEVVFRRGSGRRHSGCRASRARSRAASCATLLRISGGTSGLMPTSATASSTSPSSTSPPGGSRPSDTSSHSSRRGDRTVGTRTRECAGRGPRDPRCRSRRPTRRVRRRP